jgi:hypothetical protein
MGEATEPLGSRWIVRTRLNAYRERSAGDQGNPPGNGGLSTRNPACRQFKESRELTDMAHLSLAALAAMKPSCVAC